MLYLPVKLGHLKKLRNPSIVIVTDRTGLDEQITSTFRCCGFRTCGSPKAPGLA
jgi:type I restriction enzyme R subunit